MIEHLRAFLVAYPELALFLTIGIGYWIGGWTFGSFRLGPVTGSLFAGIAVGQFAHIDIPSTTKSFLFLLFLFGIGYPTRARCIIAVSHSARQRSVPAA